MISRAGRWGAVVALTLLAACDNELPTVTGDAGFPADQIPVTLEVTLPAEDFLESYTNYSGFESVKSSRFLLVANQFEGVLSSHGIATYTDYPDSLVYSSGGTIRRDTAFTYGQARLFAVVAPGAFPAGDIRLEVVPILQPYDTATVSWTNAVARPGNVVPWGTPGGVFGPPIASTTYGPTDTAPGDSVFFGVDSLSMTRLSTGEYAGIAVRTTTPGARLELDILIFDATFHPAGRPDTTLTQRIQFGSQGYLFTPDQPASSGLIRVGGVAGDRPYLRLNLAQRVPTCQPPRSGPGCTTVPLSDVSLAAVNLVLDPAPIAPGFRPLGGSVLTVRRLPEPELGARAPLGAILTPQPVPASVFASSTPVLLDITRAALQASVSETGILNIALLSNLGPDRFGAAWFTPTPRLRLLYTLRTPPSIP